MKPALKVSFPRVGFQPNFLPTVLFVLDVLESLFVLFYNIVAVDHFCQQTNAFTYLQTKTICNMSMIDFGEYDCNFANLVRANALATVD